ncbi:MAG: tRNA (adenosine(37)-N6)-threonylcarbamoyltransferase complex dimerization subunit type 1 TsaB [Bryobacteraceae bacterium]
MSFPNPARILAIDTTGPTGSIALVSSEGLLGEVLLTSPDGFAHVVFGEIDALLHRHNFSLHNIDGFATASGPGSFTGVRVGITAAKGLAEATGKPLVGVSNLQALASFGAMELRAPVIDARRGEVYASVYNSKLEVIQNEAVLRLASWLAGLAGRFAEIEFVTQTGALHVPLREHSLTVTEAPEALAGAIGRIALARFRNGQPDETAALDANYVRRSDAELLWREPHSQKFERRSRP